MNLYFRSLNPSHPEKISHYSALTAGATVNGCVAWERVTSSRVKLVGAEGLIVNEAPDDDASEQCREPGKTASHVIKL